MGNPAVVAVVGATATGKSDLAVELAVRFGAEVVNADSMQVYRGMDIGTAKATVQERRGVVHHLFDLWDVRRPANVAEYQTAVRSTLAEIGSRGQVAMLVGGSGLYVRAALDDLEFPGTDPALRARLEEELRATGPVALHARLAAVDPEAARRILPSNGRRVVRALEVVELTGRPFTAALPEHRYAVDAEQIGLSLPREDLDARIEARVERMWQRGLVEEVRGLEAQGLRDGVTASRALGYAQVLAFLAGECTEEEARAETIRATRRFARRQESWFRRDPRVRWLAADAPAGELADRVVRVLGDMPG
ncbi:MAG: tRNA dimethylallyltransferase [Actinomycetota bacterium]|jgi:tRNA dimethylallyltransferase|nr:tRNA dimethylallyltransferase [Actinomycetota bacterium]